MNIAIVTPTFNRENLLNRLYESLIRQSNPEFLWIIIDDGSTDNTENVIQKYMKKLNVIYVKQKNGGKAKALNTAFSLDKKIDLYVVVDSDDYLLPNAIDTIMKKGKEYKSDKRVGGIFFKYQYKNGEILGGKRDVYKEETILSRIEHDAKYDKFDGCLSYFHRTIEKYQYPEFENENYVGPTVLQMKMANEFKLVFTNEVIGVAEYQAGGLSDSGRRLRIKNPKGMLVYCHYMQDEKFNYFTRFKYGVMANAYYYIGKKENSMFEVSNNIIVPKYLKIFGIILGKYWMTKYL